MVRWLVFAQQAVAAHSMDFPKSYLSRLLPTFPKRYLSVFWPRDKERINI